MTLTFVIESVEDGRFAVSFAKCIKPILLKNQIVSQFKMMQRSIIYVMHLSFKKMIDLGD